MAQFAIPIAIAVVAAGAVFLLTKPKGTNTQGPRLSDTKVTDSAYGKPIPILRGQGRVGGNIIQSSDLENVPHTEEVDTGGKGGSSSSTNTTFTAKISFALMIGVGPIDKLVRIWFDGKIVYNITNTDGIVKKPGLNFRFYQGTEDQLPDPLIEELVGVNLAPAYRGTAYVVFEDLDLSDFGNRPPQVTVEYVELGVPLELFKVISGNPYSNQNMEEDDIAVDTDARKGYILSTGDPFNLSLNAQHLVEFDLDSMLVTRSRSLAEVINTALMGVDPALSQTRPFIVGFGKYDRHLYLEIRQPDAGFGKMIVVINTTTLSQIVVNAGTPFETARAYVNGGGFVSTTDWHRNTEGELRIGSNSKLTQLRVGNSYGQIIEFNIFVSAAYPSIGVYGLFGTPDDVNFQTESLLRGVFGHAGTGVSNTNTFCVEGGSASLSSRAEAWVVVGGNNSTSTAEASGIHTNPISYGNIVCISNGTVITLKLLQGIGIGASGPGIVPTDVDPLAVAWGRLRNLIYVPTDDTTIFFVDIYTAFAAGVVDQSTRKHYAVKMDNQGTPEIIWSKEVPPINLIGDAPNSTAPNGVSSTYTYITTTVTTLATLNVITGEYDTFSFTAAGSADTSPNMQLYDEQQDAILALTVGFIPNNAPRWVKYYLNRFSGGGVAVADVVRQLCLLVGLTDLDIDVTGITGPDYIVDGFQATSPSSARSDIDPLSVAYSFYAVESDYLLKFLPRGATDEPTEVLQRQLAAPGKKRLIEEKRIQEVDLPAYVGMTFMDKDRDYHTNTATARRPSNPSATMLSENSIEVEVPIVSDFLFMKRVAHRALYSAWQERSTYDQRLAWNFVWLDPGDPIKVSLDDGSQLVQRINKMAIGANLQLEVEGISTDPATYVSTVEGEGGAGVIRMSFPQSLVSRVFVLDMPLLIDTHNPGTGLTMDYCFMAGYGPDGWRGALMYKSPDNLTWSEVTDTTREAAWGSVQTALPDDLDPWSTDYDTQITIYPVTGSDRINSVTYEEMLNGANALAVVRNDGQVEVIQFQNATHQADGSVIVDTLLRGRRGTDVFCVGHQGYELYVLLSSRDAITKSLAFSTVGSPFFYKAVTLGTLFQDAPVVSATAQGNDLKPYMPVGFTATVVGSDIQFGWIRRTRIGGELADGTGEVPLSEDSEAYELELYDGPGGTLLRTFTSITTPDQLYLDADIVTDFGSMPSEITFKIFQISALVGRGLSRELTVEVI